MTRLVDYVELVENNMECVVLKIKPDSKTGLICLGCFSGNEIMIRLTKGNVQTCTLFFENGRSFSWYWGRGGHTIVTPQTAKCGKMIQSCIEEDFDVCIKGTEVEIKDTLYIRNAGDSKGRQQVYKLMWTYGEIYIQKNGSYLTTIKDLDGAKDYVYGRVNVTDEYQYQAENGCNVLVITGIRK